MNTEKFNYYKKLITDYAVNNYKKMFREPNGLLKYKFIVPGSVYADDLWDWDSWLTNIALRKIVTDDISEYEKGCILNYLDNIDSCGRMPIVIRPHEISPDFDKDGETNVHKPVLAQHALFICKEINDFKWIEGHFKKLKRYINFYIEKCFHKDTGLFFWIDDRAIGVDNDPCTFYRPNGSSASIYLNCLMYKELLAMADIACALDIASDIKYYSDSAENLKASINDNCWDERDGFYYSVDINLLPVDTSKMLHSGFPRTWNGIIQRIGVWSGFMALWAGIASKEQAQRIVKEHYLNKNTFNANYGVCTLSKAEKMYQIVKSGNPSCWLGPIWGISNWMVFEGLKNYGFNNEALELCFKTVEMFGKDIELNGQMHEYYHPDTGEGVNNPGFQNWNLLSINIIDWAEQNI